MRIFDAEIRMTAREYIDKTFYLLPAGTTVENVIAYCLERRVPEAYIEDAGQSVYLVRLEKIYLAQETATAVEFGDHFDLKLNYNLHWTQLLEFYRSQNVDTLPLFNDNFEYQGIVSKSLLFNRVHDLEVFHEPGAILQLQCERLIYSAAEVTRVAEMHNARVLTLFTHHNPYNQKLIVTIKLGSQETRSISATFERFGYEVIYVFMSKDAETDLFADRYESLIRLLNIK
jgi:acetoin utilization protein AcuB